MQPPNSSRASNSSLRNSYQYAEASAAHPLDPAGPSERTSTQDPAPSSLSVPSSQAPYAVYHRSTGSRSSISLTGVLASPPVSSPTTSGSVRQSSSSGTETATSKLQFQTLQGHMQSLGIKSDSLGWRFLLGFVHNEAPIKASLKGKEREKENMQWQRILHALQEPAREDLKIVLLLPRETKQRFNIATLASHILLIDPEEINAGNATPLRRVVTLTGLRGILRQGNLTFTDYAPGFPSPLPEFDLQSESFVKALFGPYHDAFIGSPTFQIEALSNSISIPRQASPSLKSDSHASRAKAAGNTATSRLASLFGGAAGSGASKTPAASSSLRSAHSDLSAADDADFETTAPPLNLNVILTDRMISWSGVCKEISDSLALHLRSDLLSAIQEQQLSHSFSNLNEIIDYIVLFLKRFEPPLHLNHSGNSSMSSPDWLPPSPSKLRVKDQEKCNLSLFADISGQLSADLVSNALQDVYEIVRQTLRAPTSGSPTEEEKPGFEDSFERDVDQMVEIVETSLTSVLHHKIFCLSQAGDAVDDETLSSRVAALGLLQLSFAHLGLDIEPEESFENNSSFTSPLSIAEQHEVKQGLDHMSKACCSELKKLSDSERLSPRAKLSVLIQTHKLIVEALSVLPTIPMRREVSTADNASITSRPSGAEVEMTDDAKSLGGRSVPPSRVGSPTQQDSKAHERTPRPGSIEKYGSDDNMPNIKLSEPILSPPTGQSGAPKQDRKNITASTSVKKGSSADVILPVLIYAVVQANPQHLASNLAYIQRFRAESFQGGESAYCLVNFQAVVEFLLNVDVDALGLDSERIVDSGDFPDNLSAHGSTSSRPGSVRLRVTNELDNITSHVTSTISGVGDMVGFFLSKTASAAPGRTIEDVKTALSGNGHPPSAVDTTNIEAKESLGAGILRRARERSKSVASTLSRQEPESTERELLDVPSSEGNNQQTEDVIAHPGSLPDNDKGSISNRLASLARLSGSSSTTTPVPSSVQSHTPSRPSVQSIFASFTSPATSLRSGASSFHEGSPPAGPTPLPEEAQSRRGSTSLDLADGAMSRFMETKSALDLRLSDVQSLLDDYKRLGRLFELQKAQSTSL